MVRFLGREIHFPRGYGPRRDSSCWFAPGFLCSGGEEHYIHTTSMFTGGFWFTVMKDTYINTQGAIPKTVQIGLFIPLLINGKINAFYPNIFRSVQCTAVQPSSLEVAHLSFKISQICVSRKLMKLWIKWVKYVKPLLPCFVDVCQTNDYVKFLSCPFNLI